MVKGKVIKKFYGHHYTFDEKNRALTDKELLPGTVIKVPKWLYDTYLENKIIKPYDTKDAAKQSGDSATDNGTKQGKRRGRKPKRS